MIGSRILPRHLRHLAATLGTVAASARTLLHLCIGMKGEAVASTGLAQLRAGVAKDRMQRRPPKHGIGSRLAHFGAVEQERQMSRCDVLTNLLRTIPCRFKTHGVRLEATVDTLLHRHCRSAIPGIAPECCASAIRAVKPTAANPKMELMTSRRLPMIKLLQFGSEEKQPPLENPHRSSPRHSTEL
jgi:hypothetical protein